MKKIFQFILAMIISYIPGFFGVVFTPHNASDAWYNALNKSVLTPDGWVFSVAWTILYALLGWALYLIISNDKTLWHGHNGCLQYFSNKRIKSLIKRM